jgi:hypothetical protein
MEDVSWHEFRKTRPEERRGGRKVNEKEEVREFRNT